MSLAGKGKHPFRSVWLRTPQQLRREESLLPWISFFFGGRSLAPSPASTVWTTSATYRKETTPTLTGGSSAWLSRRTHYPRALTPAPVAPQWSARATFVKRRTLAPAPVLVSWAARLWYAEHRRVVRRSMAPAAAALRVSLRVVPRWIAAHRHAHLSAPFALRLPRATLRLSASSITLSQTELVLHASTIRL